MYSRYHALGKEVLLGEPAQHVADCMNPQTATLIASLLNNHADTMRHRAKAWGGHPPPHNMPPLGVDGLALVGAIDDAAREAAAEIPMPVTPPEREAARRIMLADERQGQLLCELDLVRDALDVFDMTHEGQPPDYMAVALERLLGVVSRIVRECV